MQISSQNTINVQKKVNWSVCGVFIIHSGVPCSCYTQGCFFAHLKGRVPNEEKITLGVLCTWYIRVYIERTRKLVFPYIETRKIVLGLLKYRHSSHNENMRQCFSEQPYSVTPISFVSLFSCEVVITNNLATCCRDL